MLAGTVVIVWIVTGPIFHFSDNWQLMVNTGTTIVTFLMVFLIHPPARHGHRGCCHNGQYRGKTSAVRVGGERERLGFPLAYVNEPE
jgi:hypothetical protein